MNAIKSLRLKKGLTQFELAKELNLSQQAVASWENGTRSPKTVMIPKLASIFGVPIEELFKEDNYERTD